MDIKLNTKISFIADYFVTKLCKVHRYYYINSCVSVIGPLLYINIYIYINDISSPLKYNICRRYLPIINYDLEELHKWLLSLNPEKMKS